MFRLLFLAALALPMAAYAEEAPLSIELNALDQVADACRLVFVARNRGESDLDALVLEAVTFAEDGGVVQISLFDFGALPAGRPRVRQFDLPDMACDGIGSLLINGVQTCEGAATCDAGPQLSSRTDVDLLG